MNEDRLSADDDPAAAQDHVSRRGAANDSALVRGILIGYARCSTERQDPWRVRGRRQGRLRPRDRQFVYLLAFAGLRPQEARALRWGHVGERTLTVHAPKTRWHSSQPRSVRVLAPLAQELREWRLLSGRPDDDHPVIPAFNGNGTFVDHDKEWTENGYELWITRVWTTALTQGDLPYQRPNDLRHSFASLLLHEGRSVIYVARQLGHSAQLTMRTYRHVIEELDDAPRISAEDAIAAARRDDDVRQKCVEIN